MGVDVSRRALRPLVSAKAGLPAGFLLGWKDVKIVLVGEVLGIDRRWHRLPGRVPRHCQVID